VLFESGVAEAHCLRRFPVRTAGVSLNDIELIGRDVTVFDLSSPRELTDLVVNVSQVHNPNQDQDRLRKAIETLLTRNDYRDTILNLAKNRWVFIAGSLPKEAQDDPALPSRLRTFARQLTISLLQRGFSVISCPQVENIGKVVLEAYLDYRKQHRDEAIHYRIGGLYPVDLFAREKSDLDVEIQEAWKQQLHGFRKDYLTDVEWLLLVGGSVGTQEEYKAARELQTKICPFHSLVGLAIVSGKNCGALLHGLYYLGVTVLPLYQRKKLGSLVIPGVHILLRNKGNTVSESERRMCRRRHWAALHILQ
jgi:hypothetical protein